MAATSTPVRSRNAMTGKRSLAIAVGVLGAAFIAWLVTVERMQGMNGGPGTDLGTLGWYVGVWVTMMAAMMLPSALPMVLMFDSVATERQRAGKAFVPTWVFVAGYLGVWTLYGLLAYGVYRVLAGLDPAFLHWESGGRYVAG